MSLEFRKKRFSRYYFTFARYLVACGAGWFLAAVLGEYFGITDAKLSFFETGSFLFYGFVLVVLYSLVDKLAQTTALE
jgi:hypothetical protein